MLRRNAYAPDPRARQQALSLAGAGYGVRILARDRNVRRPPSECLEGVEIERVRLPLRQGRGATQISLYLAAYLRLLWRTWKLHCDSLNILPIIFYGFDPRNSKVQYSAPNNLREALTAGKPLVTGDFGEIGEFTREAQRGTVVAEHTALNIDHAFRVLRDRAVREQLGENPARQGRVSANRAKAEQLLSQQYSRLMQGAVRARNQPTGVLNAMVG